MKIRLKSKSSLETMIKLQLEFRESYSNRASSLPFDTSKKFVFSLTEDARFRTSIGASFDVSSRSSSWKEGRKERKWRERRVNWCCFTEGGDVKFSGTHRVQIRLRKLSATFLFIHGHRFYFQPREGHRAASNVGTRRSTFGNESGTFSGKKAAATIAWLSIEPRKMGNMLRYA